MVAHLILRVRNLSLVQGDFLVYNRDKPCHRHSMAVPLSLLAVVEQAQADSKDNQKMDEEGAIRICGLDKLGSWEALINLFFLVFFLHFVALLAHVAAVGTPTTCCLRVMSLHVIARLLNLFVRIYFCCFNLVPQRAFTSIWHTGCVSLLRPAFQHATIISILISPKNAWTL